MRRRPARLAAGLTVGAALLLTGCGGGPGDGPDGGRPRGQQAATFTNPVHATDTPDPQAIQVAGVWYLFHTNNRQHNVPVLTSPDLVTWAPGGDALPGLPGWADPGRTWAPEVVALAPDRYVLYYTAAASAAGRQRIGVATATAPQGPYRDTSAGPLACQVNEGGSIDASPFRDGDGGLYLLWKNDGNAIGMDTWLYAQRLSDDGLSLRGAPARLLRQTEPWEGHLVEGPFLWRHEGRLFLFYAANAYDRPAYTEGYATCETPLGPCVKAPESARAHERAAAAAVAARRPTGNAPAHREAPTPAGWSRPSCCSADGLLTRARVAPPGSFPRLAAPFGSRRRLQPARLRHASPTVEAGDQGDTDCRQDDLDDDLDPVDS